jgi:hypothetical protein
VIVHVADDVPLTPVTSGVVLYRGLADGEDPGRLHPWRELDVGDRLLDEFQRALRAPGLAARHVRNVVEGARANALSFSLQRYVSECYATSRPNAPYSKKGRLAALRMPRFRVQQSIGGGEAVLYYCEDGTVWLDPRHVFAGYTPGAFCVACFADTRNRSRVDDELLLISGGVAARWIPVTPATVTTKQFTPWEMRATQRLVCTCRTRTRRFIAPIHAKMVEVVR